MGSPPSPFLYLSPLSRCENDLSRLSDRRALTYLHTAVYPLSHFLLRSAASCLTATFVSFPMHPSALKTSGVKLRRASRQAFRCFLFFRFPTFWRLAVVMPSQYDVAVTSVIRTPKIVIWRSFQNPTTPLSPRLSSPGAPSVWLCCPPPAGSSPLAMRAYVASLVAYSLAILAPSTLPVSCIPVWILGSSDTADGVRSFPQRPPPVVGKDVVAEGD